MSNDLLDTLQVILEIIFADNHLTGAKTQPSQLIAWLVLETKSNCK